MSSMRSDSLSTIPGAGARRREGLLLERIAANAERRQAFAAMLAEDNHGDVERYCYAAARFFGPVDLNGKRVLEIGSGKGLTAMFMGLQGAATVVSMEPGLAGSRTGVLGIQQRRVAALGLGNVSELLDADFNTWDPSGRRFDIIVSQASINHLHESPHHALAHRETYDRYLAICRKVRLALEDDGVFCISDAARYGFFAMTKRLGIKRPWARQRISINWRIHQNAGVWRRILLDAGFSRVEIDYPVPYALRHLGVVAANPVTNFFLQGAFIARAYA
jgi:SAM-dependent methyltransferase